MSQELVVSQPLDMSMAQANFMPVFDIERAVQRRDMLVAFTTRIMNEGTDYGTVPGSSKNSLLKPGAEKLCTFFGLVPEFVITQQTEDWTGEQHLGEAFFYYRYKCRLSRNSLVIGEGEGSCNTWESKYRYRWHPESVVKASGVPLEHLMKRGGTIAEFEFAINKAETSGPYGKSVEHWQRFKEAIANKTARKTTKKTKSGDQKPAWEIDSWEFRVPNPDVADQVNTCQKMAQKRALVAAVLIAVNASEYFTQDIEDFEDATPPVVYHPPTAEPEPEPTPQKVSNVPLPSDEVPKPVAEMYKAMLEKKQDGYATVFNELYTSLCDLQGNKAGTETYNLILGRHGVDSWQQFKKLSVSKQCVLALYNEIQASAKSKSPTEEAEPIEGELFEVGA